MEPDRRLLNILQVASAPVAAVALARPPYDALTIAGLVGCAMIFLISAYNLARPERPSARGGKPAPSEWNWVTVMLNQAMADAISDNFRAVVLSHRCDHWLLQVWLRDEDQQDREEVDGIVDLFAVYLIDVKDELTRHSYIPMRTEIIVTAEPLNLKSGGDGRLLFSRRED